jgi:hypothetical protein
MSTAGSIRPNPKPCNLMSSALRCLGVAAVLLLAPAPASEAHPLALDVSRMPGFKVLTAEDGVVDARNLAIIEYDGPIISPMAKNLRAIWNEIAKDSRFERVVLRLNSRGGTDLHGKKVIEVLAAIRERVALTTLVGENDLCASMCIALYIQGDKRFASPASTWMFHGASNALNNIPSLSMTTRYFDLFKERDIDHRFVDFLFRNNYVTTPGAYWISGRELAQQSNIITDLLPNWMPADPVSEPSGSIMSGI